MTTCTLVRRDLGAFVDGELTGTRRQRVARHLEACADCAEQVQTIVGVGDALRASAARSPRMPSFAGMAATVISLTRAESALSWRSRVSHGFDDWHWAMIGGGALVATLVCTTCLSALLAFGPRPAREDSLSALMANLGSPAGMLFVCGSPGGSRQNTAVFQVDNGQPVASRMAVDLASLSCRPVSEADIVDALAIAVTRGERVVTLEAMHPEQRKKVEGLLAEIMSQRAAKPADVSQSLHVQGVRLVTGTSVVAKAL